MSMVEVVARAMATSDRPPGYEIDEWADKTWRDYARYARAALEALRVPSDEMVDAGVDEWVKPGRGMWHAMHASFAAMITAALGETE